MMTSNGRTIRLAARAQRPRLAAGCLLLAALSSPIARAGQDAAGGPAAAADDIAADLAAARAAEARRVEIFARAARSVVCIFDSAASVSAGGGSGVIIDPAGYGLTNFHVVADFVESRRGVGGLSDGNLYHLQLLGIDPGGDIALFKLEGKRRFDFAPLGDSDQLAVGQWVAAMGNPFVLAEDFRPTITQGIISGLHRYQVGQGNLLEYADCIQVSTSINPGNSGGPLFDLHGRLIGINGRASFEERGRVNVGLGYAVTINQIRRFIPGLLAGGMVEHGTLSATVRPAGQRVIFNAIQDFAAAERAGVELGDELISIHGRPIHTPNDFNNIINTFPSGWPVALRVRRGERELELTARLDRLPVRAGMIYLRDPELNQREVRRFFDRWRSGSGVDRIDSTAELLLRGRLHAADGPPQEIILRHRPLTRLVVQDAEHSLTLPIVSPGTQPASQPVPPADIEGAPHLDPDLWTEWLELTEPLLAQPQLSLDWELIGGDETAGRIAVVIQHRLADDRRVRWFLDLDTAEPLRAIVLKDAQTVSATWDFEQPVRHGGIVLPRHWKRTQADRSLLIEWESWSAGLSATRPAGDAAEGAR